MIHKLEYTIRQHKEDSLQLVGTVQKQERFSKLIQTGDNEGCKSSGRLHRKNMLIIRCATDAVKKSHFVGL